jgi:hypothetical protein
MRKYRRLMTGGLLASTFVLMAYIGMAQSGQVKLTVRLANNAKQFHVGEMIPIKLSFSASVPDTFEMDSRMYDRSGRLGLEGFMVTPKGRDPLQAFYQLRTSFIGGGLSQGPKRLTSTPETIAEEASHENHYAYVCINGNHRISLGSGPKRRHMEIIHCQIDTSVG